MLLDAARALLALLVLVSSIGCRGEVVGPDRCGGCPAGGMKISMNALLRVPYTTKDNKTATWIAPIPNSATVTMACEDELNSHPNKGTQQVEITWTDWDPVTTATTEAVVTTTEAATTTTEVSTTTGLTTSIDGMTTEAGTTTTEAWTTTTDAGTTTTDAGTTTTEAETTTTEAWTTTTEVPATTSESPATTEVPTSTESTTSLSSTTTEVPTTSEATSTIETTIVTTEDITTSTPSPTTTEAASTAQTTIATTEAIITSTELPTTTQEASSADAMTTTQAMTSATEAETTTTEASTTTEVASSTDPTTITTGAVTTEFTTQSTTADRVTSEAPPTTVDTASTDTESTTPRTSGTTEVVTETTTDSTESETVTRSTLEIVTGPITVPSPSIPGLVMDISDENNQTEGPEVTPSSEEADADTDVFSVADKNIFRQVRQASDTEPQTPVHGAGQKGTTRMVSPNSSGQNRLVLRFKQDDETYHVNEVELRVDLTSFNLEDIEDSPRLLRAVSTNLDLFRTPVKFTHGCESSIVLLDSSEQFYINFTDLTLAAFLPSESTCDFPPELWTCGIPLPMQDVDSGGRQVLLLSLGITLGVIVVIALALHLLRVHCRSHNASRSSGPA